MELSLLELGTELRRRRVASGLSQQQLAKLLDIPQAQVSVLEQFGRGMKFERILVVCKHFGLRMVWEETEVDGTEDPPAMVKVVDEIVKEASA